MRDRTESIIFTLGFLFVLMLAGVLAVAFSGG